ncbi:MAG: RNA polymerase sigma factor [Armatimonadota bacterium]
MSLYADRATGSAVDKTDMELVWAIRRRVRKGQTPDAETESLFRELYRRHVNACYAIVRRKVHPDDVEDVLGEVWVGVWKVIASGREITSFPGLLCRITRNKVADACQARYGAEASLSAWEEGKQWQEHVWTEEADIDPERELVRLEEAQRVRTLLAGLHRPWRLAIQCRLSLQMSVRETAERLGVSEGAVKKYVARGLKALRRQMDGDPDYWRDPADEEGGQI